MHIILDFLCAIGLNLRSQSQFKRGVVGFGNGAG